MIEKKLKKYLDQLGDVYTILYGKYSDESKFNLSCSGYTKCNPKERITLLAYSLKDLCDTYELDAKEVLKVFSKFILNMEDSKDDTEE